MDYSVQIGIQGGFGQGLHYLNEYGKSREWVEENIAAPRREARDILFQGEVLNWRQIKSIQIFRVSQTSPYEQGRGRGRAQPTQIEVTHEFITGAPGAHASSRGNSPNSLAEFSDEQLIEELRRRLGRHG